MQVKVGGRKTSRHTHTHKDRPTNIEADKQAIVSVIQCLFSNTVGQRKEKGISQR